MQTQSRNVLAGTEQGLLQWLYFVVFDQLSRNQLLPRAQDRRHPYGLTYVRTGSHDPGRSEGYVRSTDDAACQKQVSDVPAVQTPVGNAVHAFAVPLVATRFFAENAIGGMQINGPATEGYGIRM